jgi:hypothetical protein
MPAPTVQSRAHACLRAAPCVICALLGVGVVPQASAQQVTDPGNLIIQRAITPRDAFVPVPKNQDPIAVQVETFPASAFDGAVGSMATDLDLNGAHGSSGVGGGGLTPVLGGANGVGELGHTIGANAGNSIPVGAGASVGGVGGLGGSIAQSVNNALAPIGAAMGAIK